MEVAVHTLEQYFVKSGRPNLPFHIESIEETSETKGIHCHDFFQIIFIDEGEAEHTIEYDPPLRMTAHTISVLFPKQIHQIAFSCGCKGVVFRFDEALFCSDILKKELSAYTINLYRKLNYIDYRQTNYPNARAIVNQICLLNDRITPIKKEQIRFYIKILLLQLIEDVHDKHDQGKLLPDVNLYAKYKELIENQFHKTKTVAGYASQIGITTKKLNHICKKEAGMTPLEVLHERIIVEAKRLLLFSGESIKEIAFRLGFASPSSFDKFIYSKTNKTPTELKNSLSQNNKIKD